MGKLKIGVLAAALVAAGVMQASPARAAGGTVATDAQVYAAVEAASETGRWASGAKALVLTRPDLASQLIDPTVDGMTVTAGEQADYTAGDPLPPSVSALSYATRQRTIDRYINYFSITGGKVLEYHFKVTWDYNGKTVPYTPVRAHYIRASTWYIYDRGFTANSAVAKPGRYAWTITMQALWEQCVATYGCIANGHPYTQVGVYYDGTYHITQRR